MPNNHTQIKNIAHLCCNNGIEQFTEYEKDISAGHKQLEQAQVGIPLSYILIGKKSR
jgi:hypothetical protein